MRERRREARGLTINPKPHHPKPQTTVGQEGLDGSVMPTQRSDHERRAPLAISRMHFGRKQQQQPAETQEPRAGPRPERETEGGEGEGGGSRE
jgi:hypothetical protein